MPTSANSTSFSWVLLVHSTFSLSECMPQWNIDLSIKIFMSWHGQLSLIDCCLSPRQVLYHSIRLHQYKAFCMGLEHSVNTLSLQTSSPALREDPDLTPRPSDVTVTMLSHGRPKPLLSWTQTQVHCKESSLSRWQSVFVVFWQLPRMQIRWGHILVEKYTS